MCGSCIGIDYELYGHIIGIYSRSGERGRRKVGTRKERKRSGRRNIKEPR